MPRGSRWVGVPKEEVHEAMRRMREKSQVVRKEKAVGREDNFAKFMAMNPFATIQEMKQALGTKSALSVYHRLRQKPFREKVLAYKQEYINPNISETLTQRFTNLTIMAIERMEARVNDPKCKDQTLVEIFRISSQQLMQKGGNVNINTGKGSLVSILSGLQSSSQEALEDKSAPQEKLVEGGETLD